MNQGDVTASGRHSLDIWHVRLANGETRALSLDDLDAAFQAGWVDERTPVLAAGAIRWAPLAEVAGLDAEPPASSMPNSIAPIALDMSGLDIPSGGGHLPLDLDAMESDAEVEAFRPRRGRKIFGALTAMVVVAGLGFAAFRAKPAISRALASRGTPAPVTAPEPKPAPVQAAPPPPAPAPVPEAAPTQAIPTMTATALPNASASPADARKAKRSQKRK